MLPGASWRGRSPLATGLEAVKTPARCDLYVILRAQSSPLVSVNVFSRCSFSSLLNQQPPKILYEALGKHRTINRSL
jgi:hypothetical protein